MTELQNKLALRGRPIPGRYVTISDIIEELQDTLRGTTQKELAAAMGISTQYLSDILHYRRSPGQKVLRYLRLGESTFYLAY